MGKELDVETAFDRYVIEAVEGNPCMCDFEDFQAGFYIGKNAFQIPGSLIREARDALKFGEGIDVNLALSAIVDWVELEQEDG